MRQMLIGLALLISFSVGGVLWIGSDLVAPANRDLGQPPSDLPMTEFTLESKSGSEIAVWYAPVENAQVTVLLLHPIRGSRNSMIDRSYFLREAGYSVMLIDLQGHGESLGKQITLGHLEKLDVQAAVNDIRKKHPQQQVVIIGRSLGGASALLAMPMNVDALVLESVCPAVDNAIRNRVQVRLGPLSHVLSPFLTLQIKPRVGASLDELRSIDKIREVTCPVLLLAGQNDRRTTIQDTQELFDAANEPKQMEIFQKATHVDLFRLDEEFYKEKVMAFLNEYVPAGGTQKP